MIIQIHAGIALFFLWSAHNALCADTMISENLAETDIDILSCQLTVATFSGYAAHLKKSEPALNLQEPIKRDRSVLGYSFSQEYPALPQLADWHFIPFTGHLGFYASLFCRKPTEEYFGMVGYNEIKNLVCISFRGTQPVSEYAYANLNFSVKMPISRQTPRSIRNLECVEGWHHLPFDGPLHAGYYNRLITCEASLADALTQLKEHYKDKDEQEKPTLLLTGHSLGGASCCLAAGWAIADKPEKEGAPGEKLFGFGKEFSKIYLRPFGAPRVSIETYGPWLQEKGVDIKHHVCETDSIPLFPIIQLREWGWPYSLRFTDITPAEKLDSFGIGYRQFISAHDVRLYWKALAKKKGRTEEFPLFTLSADTNQIKSILFPPS